MKQVFEFGGFLVAALAVHVVAIPPGPGTSGATQGGDGAGSVTLVATPESLSNLVQAWETPPQVMTTAALAPAPPRPTDTLPAAATSTPRQLSPAVPALPLSPTAPDVPPQIDLTARPQPVTRAAPTESPRPESRPVRRTEVQQPRAASPSAPAPSPRETSSGGGQSPTAGTVRSAPAAPAPQTPRTNTAALSQWGSAIRSSIERRKRYPSGTRARGTVTLSISVNSNGGLVGVSIVGPSGDAALDRAGANAVQRARLPAAPSGVAPGTHRFTLPMSFSP